MRSSEVKSGNSLHPSGTVIKAFARRVRDWRLEAGLPLKHVARDLGVSVSIVCEWEHGNRFPSIAHLEAISRYVGIPVCCLLFHGHGHCPHAQTIAVGGSDCSTAKPSRPKQRMPAPRPSG